MTLGTSFVCEEGYVFFVAAAATCSRLFFEFFCMAIENTFSSVKLTKLTSLVEYFFQRLL